MVEKSDKIWRIKHVRKFDKQNFDKSIVGFIGKILQGRLEVKTLNRWPFIKFFRLFHCQKFCAIQYMVYSIILSVLLGYF